MFGKLPGSVTSIPRYREILGVLLKYGFEELLSRIGVADLRLVMKRRFSRGKSPVDISLKTLPERMRLSIEELGPTFIKLGQMLSTRPDFIPVEYLKELEKLQDRISPFPSDVARQLLEKELEKPLDLLFSEFDDKPVAAASLAQVHRAVTIEGQEVALKIQRPGIRRTIEQDLRILNDLAPLFKRHMGNQNICDPVAIVSEFSKWIRKELDFYQEGQNIERFNDYFDRDTAGRAPEVYWAYSTPRLLAMEYVHGLHILDVKQMKQLNIDPREIAQRGAQLTLRQVFKYGFFHGDPHPGNMCVEKNGGIVLLDYGLMGRLNDELMEHLAQLLSAALTRDVTRIIRVLKNIGAMDDEMPTEALKTDLDEFIDRYYEVPLARINTEAVMNDILNLTSIHGMRLPANLYLMAKSFVVVENIGRQLDPEFDLASMLRPHLRDLMSKQFNYSRMQRDMTRFFEESRELVDVVPGSLKYILMKLRSGRLGVNIDHHGLDGLIQEIDRSSNRLSFSLIIAAIIIGSSFIMQSDVGPTIFEMPMLGFIGYVFAGLMGGWLVISIIWSRRL